MCCSPEHILGVACMPSQVIDLSNSLGEEMHLRSKVAEINF